MKWEWYVAIDTVGRPQVIYGPYTEKQAKEVAEIAEFAPRGKLTVAIFKADGRPPIRKLLQDVRDLVEKENR